MTEGRDGHPGNEVDYRRLIACHQIVTTVASAFVSIPMDEVDRGIEGALKSIGRFSGARRGQLFILNGEKTRFDSTHEWCSEGTESHRGRMQNIDVESFPWYMDNFRRLQGIVIRNLKDIPEDGGRERQHLESMGIRSSIAVPFSRRGSFVGFMTFDSPDGDMSLPGECVALLAVVGEMFVGAMDRRRMNQALRESEEFMTALTSNIPGLVYRIATHRDGSTSMYYMSPGPQNLTWLGEGVFDGSGQDVFSAVHEDDRPLMDRAMASAWDDPRPIDLEFRLVLPSGETRWVRDIARPHMAEDEIIWDGVIIDITDRKETEEALSHSENKCATLVETAADAIFTVDENGDFISANRAAARYMGREPHEMVGSNLRDVFPEEAAEVHLRGVRSVFETGEARTRLDSHEVTDIGEKWFNTTISPVKDADGKVLWALGISRDITERKEAETNLEESERRFRSLFEKAPIGIGVAAMDGRVIAWNEAVVTTLGLSPEELLNLNVNELYQNPEDREYVLARLREDGVVRDHDVMLRRRGGETFQARLMVETIQYEGQDVLMTAVEDITDRKRAEFLLRLQRDMAVRIGSTTELSQALDYLLEATCRIDGLDCGGFYSIDYRTGDLELLAHRGLSDEFIRDVSHFSPDSPNTGIVMAGEPVFATYSELGTNQGKTEIQEGLKGIAVIPVKHESRVIGALNISSHTHEEIPHPARDMLEAIAAQVGGLLARFRSEEALRESEGLHRLLADNISDVIWTMDVDIKKVSYVSPSIRHLTGFTPDEVMRMSMIELLAPESLEKAAGVIGSVVKELEEGTFEPMTVELDLLRRDGEAVSVETRISAVYGHEGVPSYILGVTRDVSERKRLEEQLRQSAKMQAIGELAGGVAHEFNNMLTGILGYASMLRLTAEPGTSVYESARTIEKAAERASDLTRKLLGFARRGRQRREPVDIHGVIRDVVSLLRQTVSERIHISCEMNAEDIVITGDPAQMEQVLLNLALNARDAMPTGGDLVLKTGIEEFNDPRTLPEPDIRPGRFAVLTVSDTGSGINPEDMGRIFEPFFTTKGKGRGTGMGLAMIYGTVRNHAGFITVESTPGQGTTFKAHFPLEVDVVQDEQPPPSAPAPDSGTGRILVVDDEEMIRDVARSLLEVCGYEVVTMSNGLEAVDYYRDHGGGIDLVIIDMVMPEMSGRECFQALRELDPNVRAVLSTGYGANGEAREIVQDGMAGIVLKPFSKGALSAAVREALSENVVTAK